MTTMLALQVHGAEDMPVVSIDRPTPKADEVLIEVAYCGICGSDFPRYFDGAVHSTPQTLGHEFSGVVVEVGEDVSGIGIGKRVAVAPLVPCGKCEMCEAGRLALCTSYSYIGSRQQGGLAEFVTVPARNVVALPDAVSLRDAALIEPLSVALHGIDRADLNGVSTAMVFGSGVIGLLTVTALKAKGIDHVIAVDVQPEKLELAQRLGADDVVLGSEVENYIAQHGHPELSIETAGHPATQVQAVEFTANAGQVVFVGTCTRPVSFDPKQFERILRGELRLTGSWMSYSAPFPGSEWSDAVSMIADGSLNVSSLVSEEYELSDAGRVFDDVKQSGGSMLKVLYRIRGEDQGEQ